MSRRAHNTSTIALGGNVEGRWGAPADTIRKCVQCLSKQGFSEIRVSPIYRTKPFGSVRQPDYLNCVIQARCAISPRKALDMFKHIERRAGRRLMGRNAPRPLDIDLLDLGGRIVNWPVSRHRPKLVLPHPLLTDRAFVLVPLAALAPNWLHPVYGLSASQLLIRLGGLRSTMLRREIFPIEQISISCDKYGSCA